MGSGEEDGKESSILNRVARVIYEGYEYEAVPKHRAKLNNYHGFNDKTKRLSFNGDREDRQGKLREFLELNMEETKSLRVVAARMYFMSQDCLDIQISNKNRGVEISYPEVDS